MNKITEKTLREIHDIHISILPHFNKTSNKLNYSYAISHKNNGYDGYSDNLDVWLGVAAPCDKSFHVKETYEEALNSAITEASELINN